MDAGRGNKKGVDRMEFERIKIQKDFVIIGAGMAGICAAVQAARLGLTVALVNNRGYLGGNASAEIGVIVNGATGSQEFNFHARETGIIEEILLENLHRNPQGNRYIWDTVLLDFVRREKNITLFANTNVDKVIVDNSQIKCVSGAQSGTEKRFDFEGRFYLDSTGDGTVGYLAGAEYKMGREAKAEFGERIAPDNQDKYVLPSTLVFCSKDVGRPIKYIAPDFALDIEKSGVLRYREIPENGFNSKWYYEVGGEYDQIKDNEEIIQKHRELVYGIWDYIKNSGKYQSENYDLEYVSCIPGKRESRRLIGDYILNENDITARRDFEDTVAYGGWSIDLHAIEGFFSKEQKNKHIYLKGIYQIPYRSGYSKNIPNLFIGGRNMSTSHVAFGTTRVMSTLAIFAEALAVAAYLCVKHDTTPKGVYESYLEELHQLLIMQDHYVVGKRLADKNDIVQGARLTASSTKKFEAVRIDEMKSVNCNMAVSMPLNGKIESISVPIRSEMGTTLEYEIYLPLKRESYSPDNLLKKGTVKIAPSKEVQWVELAVDKEIDCYFAFIKIMENKSLEIGISNEKLAGVICMEEQALNNPHCIDVETLIQKKTLCEEQKYSICFKVYPEQSTYSADNIKNGWIRPFGSPNLWVSDNKVNNEWVSISFNEMKKISELNIFFNSDLNTRYMNTRPYDFNAFSQVVKDYTVYYKKGNEYIVLLEVKDNFQRVNRLRFEPLETQEIKIVFDKTNGHNCVELYSLYMR